MPLPTLSSEPTPGTLPASLAVLGQVVLDAVVDDVGDQVRDLVVLHDGVQDVVARVFQG